MSSSTTAGAVSLSMNIRTSGSRKTMNTTAHKPMYAIESFTPVHARWRGSPGD